MTMTTTMMMMMTMMRVVEENLGNAAAADDYRYREKRFPFDYPQGHAEIVKLLLQFPYDTALMQVN